MSPRLSFPVLVAALALASLLSACSEADISDIGTALLSISSDLDKNPDPNVKAAGAASNAVDREKEARKLAGEALGDKGQLDFAKMDKAIELDPTSADRRLEKAVMQIAAGQDSTQTLGEARFLAQRYSGLPSSVVDGIVVSVLASELRTALGKYEKTSAEYGRLQKQLCAETRLYDKDYAKENVTISQKSDGC